MVWERTHNTQTPCYEVCHMHPRAHKQSLDSKHTYLSFGLALQHDCISSW